jgi:glycosyltransferase involved in cell wall biosynthesis
MVTIAVPTYNRAAKLRHAIESVIAQDHAPLELVISDNASTDGTQAVCEEYAARHAWIRYVRQPTNVGPTRNFESVRELARGEFILFLADDDWLDPGYVSACVASIEADPGSSLVAGRTLHHRPASVDVDTDPVNLEDADPRRRVLEYCRQVRGNAVFYGVVPTRVDRQVPVIPNVMGNDWLHVMALAYLGRVRTLDTVTLHRAAGGASVTLANAATTLGLGWIQATAPQIAIAYWVFRDIAIDSPVYAELGRRRRLWLGTRASAIITVRFVPGAVVKFFRLKAGAVGRRLRGRQAVSDR